MTSAPIFLVLPVLVLGAAAPRFVAFASARRPTVTRGGTGKPMPTSGRGPPEAGAITALLNLESWLHRHVDVPDLGGSIPAFPFLATHVLGIALVVTQTDEDAS